MSTDDMMSVTVYVTEEDKKKLKMLFEKGVLSGYVADDLPYDKVSETLVYAVDIWF